MTIGPHARTALRTAIRAAMTTASPNGRLAATERQVDVATAYAIDQVEIGLLRDRIAADARAQDAE